MTLQELIFTVLTGATELEDYVGDRIYPMIAPQSVDLSLSRIVYQVIDVQPVYSHDGYSDLDRTVFQLSVQSKNYDDAKYIASACRLALDAEIDSERYSRFVCENESEYSDSPNDSTDIPFFYIVQSYRVYNRKENEYGS